MTMKELIQLLNQASETYYQGSPIMSDVEFDKLYDELEELEKKTNIIYSNSPTQNVGAKILNNLNKVKITEQPMLSLGKCHSAEEVIEFSNGHELVGMLKCDGISVRLRYENGKLMAANSRGNGEIGSDITAHVTQFINIPLQIPTKETVIIDGEAIIKYDDFNIINKNNEFKNPRNTAAGTLNCLETQLVKDRRLSFIAWDLINNKELLTMVERLEIMQNWGFEVTPYQLVSEVNRENVEKINTSLSQNSNIPWDGIVWKFNDLAYGESLGRTAHHFNWAIAWKPEIETYETRLLEIDWTMGRTGILTPVAIFEPVDDGESIIERASLHNLSIMENVLGKPFIYQPISIYKANLIIPQVLRAENKPLMEFQYDEDTKVTIKGKYLEIPTTCPICGEELIIKQENDTKVLVCPNELCEGKFLNQLVHFCSKKGLDIRGLSKNTLEKLVDWGWISNLSDIFNLSIYEVEWVQKPGFGQKSVANILKAIENSKNCTLEAFISSLGIPLIGLNVAKELVKYIQSYEDFRNKIETQYDFTEINGFGENKTHSLLSYNYEQADIISKLLSFKESPQQEKNDSLKGMTIVVTGHLNNFKNRTELQTIIEQNGGHVVNSISKNTTYLINNNLESNSAKNQAAKRLGIPIITEEKFIQDFLTY